MTLREKTGPRRQLRRSNSPLLQTATKWTKILGRRELTPAFSVTCIGDIFLSSFDVLWKQLNDRSLWNWQNFPVISGRIGKWIISTDLKLLKIVYFAYFPIYGIIQTIWLQSQSAFNSDFRLNRAVTTFNIRKLQTFKAVDFSLTDDFLILLPFKSNKSVFHHWKSSLIVKKSVVVTQTR